MVRRPGGCTTAALKFRGREIALRFRLRRYRHSKKWKKASCSPRRVAEVAGVKQPRNLGQRFALCLYPYQGALRSAPAPVPARPGEASGCAGCGFVTVLDTAKGFISCITGHTHLISLVH